MRKEKAVTAKIDVPLYGAKVVFDTNPGQAFIGPDLEECVAEAKLLQSFGEEMGLSTVFYAEGLAERICTSDATLVVLREEIGWRQQ